MSVIDTLITDRTDLDIENLEVLESAIQGGRATEAEIAAYFAGTSKGAYNATDLNRVGNAINYVAGLLNGAGYSVSASPKTDWEKTDEPTPEQLEDYLAQVQTLRSVLTLWPSTPAVPPDMEDLTTDEANAIEQILVDLDAVITSMQQVYLRAGVPWNVAGNNYYIRN